MLKRLTQYAIDSVRRIRYENRFCQARLWNRVYKKEDPWQYRINSDDARRKHLVIDLARRFSPEHGYQRALDIGAGEGWITTDLPAREIYGYDASNIAMSRFPPNVRPLRRVRGTFDLVIATGVLYEGYRYEWTVRKINECASSIVITAAIKELERGVQEIQGEQVYCIEFIHTNMQAIQQLQVVRVFRRAFGAPARRLT